MNDATVGIEASALLVVDPQPTFLKAIPNADAILRRIRFLAEVANILDVPVFVTTQNEPRMGGIDPSLADVLRPAKATIDKMTFSAGLSDPLFRHLDRADRVQVVVCGIETHICVCQTALDLLTSEYDVFIPVDAVGARLPDAHAIAIERLRDSGAFVTHSESVVYEWLGTASHPAFRSVLELVKASVPV